jgi:hypothetical protein
MHGQKKRRKRFKDGSIAIDGFRLYWKLISEPLATIFGPYRDTQTLISVFSTPHRELILEYPFSQKPHGTFQFPQRPKFSENRRNRRSKGYGGGLAAGFKGKDVHSSPILSL